jgi:hypothetical protein
VKAARQVTQPFAELRRTMRAESMAKDHLRERLIVVAVVTVVVALVCSVLALHFERHGPGTEITNYGDAFFWVSTQLLTVSSQMKNPVTTDGRILDVFMEIYAISVVATLAGSFGAFFHHRSREREEEAARKQEQV